MQRHPSPECKAAHSDKAAPARKAGLTHNYALLVANVYIHVYSVCSMADTAACQLVEQSDMNGLCSR
jgi:hypothetical protein